MKIFDNSSTFSGVMCKCDSQLEASFFFIEMNNMFLCQDLNLSPLNTVSMLWPISYEDKQSRTQAHECV